jgi:hypothetical protein
VVLHGGDLADGGSNPVGVVDRIRELGWQGVGGNTDELLYRPESLDEFAQGVPPERRSIFIILQEMARWTRELLGDERLEWLRCLPISQNRDEFSLVHASPDSRWRAPGPGATDAQLETTYSSLDSPTVIYGHIHEPYVRHMRGLTIANCGSVGLPYDNDPRASYLLLDHGRPSICRVEYNIAAEINALRKSGLPHAEWVAHMLQTATMQMP